MSEKRFLSFVLTEGILLTALSLLLLILPKITEIAFGFLLCIILIVYGGYKAILAFLSRNFEAHYILNIISGLLLFGVGILMFFAPVIDMIIVTSILAVYFVLSCISSSAFTYQVKNILPSTKCGFFLGGIQLVFAIILMLFLPSIWIGGVFVGINLLITGILLINMYIAKKYNS